MLSERITKLFTLLQCSNTDIARYAGCSPSNVSRLKSGGREPRQNSRTILRLVRGVYAYADYENMLPLLQELTGAPDNRPEELVPALVSWLFDTADFEMPRALTPQSRWTQELRRQSFGDRLARAVTLLELSNAQLAAALNVDVSLVSRWRSGLHSPHRNAALAERLADVLFARAERSGKTAELSELCCSGALELDAETLLEWFCGAVEEPAALAQLLLRQVDSLTPESAPPPLAAAPAVREEERYWGAEGLRAAVVRFLTEAEREGGELLLYSDEPMGWMGGKEGFPALWNALMTACVRRGVRIRVIHNLDRSTAEMVNGIKGWLPLYLTGGIEPYVFRRVKNARFHHTIFLRPGGACVCGLFPAGTGEGRWYDYITDAARLDSLRAGFDAMLAVASPFLRTYPIAAGGAFRDFCDRQTAPRSYLLSGLPVFTMPEELLRGILSRAEPDEARRAELASLYRRRRERFFDSLRRESVNLIFCPPDRETALGGVPINFAADLLELPLCYTPGEYARHLEAVAELVRTEKNFHMTLLPNILLRDSQVVTLGDAVAVLRCREPSAAFVFSGPSLTRSIADYSASLIELYATDRRTTEQALLRLRPEA